MIDVPDPCIHTMTIKEHPTQNLKQICTAF